MPPEHFSEIVRERDALRERVDELLERLADPNTLILSDYEIANLRELLRAVGWPWDESLGRSPFNVANTGDWVGMIAQKLPELDHWVCAPAEAMAENARLWRDLSR